MDLNFLSYLKPKFRNQVKSRDGRYFLYDRALKCIQRDRFMEAFIITFTLKPLVNERLFAKYLNETFEVINVCMKTNPSMKHEFVIEQLDPYIDEHNVYEYTEELTD